MKKYVNAANILTFLRIPCALGIVFAAQFSLLFWAIGGLTDALDGFIARKTNVTSRFGEIFDTIADMVFFCAVIFNYIRYVHVWVYITCAIVICARIVLCIITKRFYFPHTLYSKIAGIAVFAFPAISFISMSIAEAVAVAAACVNTIADLCSAYFLYRK